MVQAVAQRVVLPAQRVSERLPLIGAWLLGFLPLAVLAFEGGGYDAVIRSQVGIAVWWILALGCLVGAITPAFPSRRALLAATLLAALGVWSWIGIATSESAERTLGEVARIATYLGMFLLGLWTLDRRRAPVALLGVASAIVLVAGLAVLSRLQPALFPANDTGAFLSIAQSRLNWPLNYWNGLAAFCALGVPLALTFAAGHRSVAVRALSAGALPVLALCISLTISRGGIVASAIAVAVVLFAAPDRKRTLASLAVGGLASAILLGAAAQRGLVHEDLRSATALEQGDELTWVMLVVVLGACLVQAGIAVLEPIRLPFQVPPRPISRRALATTGVVALLLVLGVAIAAGAPGRLADAWQEFKTPAVQQDISDSDTSRLGSLSSNGRYQLWNLALDSMAHNPVLGTGAGTYEFTWLRETPIGRTVRDAHSFYLETGAETGVIGLILALALVVTLLSPIASIRAADPHVRLTLGGAVAGVSAFAFAATVDWVWELPAISIAALLLAAAALAAHRDPGEASPLRGSSAALPGSALVIVVMLAMVLASASAVQQSRADARVGNFPAALEHARDAHAVLAAGATPLLQSALVEEQAGNFAAATEDARRAAKREPANWRTWLVVSRLEARAGEPAASIAAFRRARELNPKHPIFTR